MLSMFSLLVTFSAYALDQYDVSAGIAGFVSSVFMLGVLVGRLYGGWKIKVLRAKRLMIIGTIIFLAMNVLYLFQPPIFLLIFVRLVQGIGLGFSTTSTGTIVSQILPYKRNGEGISIFSSGGVLPAAIGPFLSTKIIIHYDYVGLFTFSLAIGIIAFLLALPFTYKEPVIAEDQDHTPKFRLSHFLELQLIPISTVVLISAFAYSAILSFVTIYSEQLHLENAASLYFLVYAAIVLITRPFFGRILDYKGANTVIYPSLIAFAIGMYILSQSTSSILFVCAALFIGFGYGNFQSVTQALAVKMTPIERVGLANSTYFIFLDVGLGMGPFLLGYLIPLFQLDGLYFGLTFLIVCNVFIYFYIFDQQNRKQPYRQSR